MNKNEKIALLTKKHVAQTYGRYPIALVRGKGTKVWDKAGKQYLDFVSGLAVDNLGHCHPAVVSAIQNQAENLLHVSNLYHIEPQSQLAEKLTSLCFADKIFFCNSGTEAIESAIKLARKFSFDQGHPERNEIITMHNSFHGRTLGALSATAQKKFHTGFQPLLPGFKYVPFNNIQAVKKAINKKTGARGLRSILENILLKTMYDLPSQDNVEEVIVDASAAKGLSQPIIVHSKNNTKTKTDKTSAA